MKFPELFSNILTLALVVAVPGALFAQDAPPAQSTAKAAQQQSQPDSQTQPAQQQPTSTGPGMVDPSAAPLSPAPPTPEPQTTSPQLPSAPSTSQQSTAPRPPAATTQEPLGTAAAESVRAVGGGASRPAGTAIAPAKQKQSRSLLIKLGAVAAIGVAAGVVYALSRGTSSVPPNTR